MHPKYYLTALFLYDSFHAKTVDDIRSYIGIPSIYD